MDFHDRRDDSHIDMAVEAAKHTAAKTHGVDPSSVKVLHQGPGRELRHQEWGEDSRLHETGRVDTVHEVHLGWGTGDGNRTGASYEVGSTGEHLREHYKWPVYSKENSPYQSGDWGD